MATFSITISTMEKEPILTTNIILILILTMMIFSKAVWDFRIIFSILIANQTMSKLAILTIISLIIRTIQILLHKLIFRLSRI
jgi:hypothetical protein